MGDGLVELNLKGDFVSDIYDAAVFFLTTRWLREGPRLASSLYSQHLSFAKAHNKPWNNF